MNVRYPGLSILIPLCAGTAHGDWLSEGYQLREHQQIVMTSTSLPAPTLNLYESIKADSVRAALTSMVREEIKHVLAGSESLEARMAALDSYIEDNQSAVREWLKTMKTATEDSNG